jgi:hypothetical protein
MFEEIAQVTEHRIVSSYSVLGLRNVCDKDAYQE